jgi:hypothetical protein
MRSVVQHLHLQREGRQSQLWKRALAVGGFFKARICALISSKQLYYFGLGLGQVGLRFEFGEISP